MSSKVNIVAVLLLSLSILPMIASVQAQSPDFSLTPTSFSLLFQQGIQSARSVTFNVTSLNGFHGKISFTITPVPTGYSTNIKPASVTLNSGGSATTKLTVSYNGDPADCTSFRMTFTATSGSLVHTSSGFANCAI